jgi:hypothetical protein
MIWRILPHATVCIASDKLIVLDLRRDRYFCVPDSIAGEMRAWLEQRHNSAPPPASAHMLEKAGVRRESDPIPTNALKDRILVPDGFAKFDAGSEPAARTVSVARQVAATWISLRLVPLERIVSTRHTRAPLPLNGDLQATLTLAATFERSRPFVPIARNCLLDSLALDSWLARRGVGAQLIFGVVAEPFAAHCWLQTKEALLNDSYDNVSSFTPILAL